MTAKLVNSRAADKFRFALRLFASSYWRVLGKQCQLGFYASPGGTAQSQNR